MSTSNKEPMWIKMLREGTVITNNTFDTDRGCYTIRIVEYGGCIYYHKMRNGAMLELKNITQIIKKVKANKKANEGE